MIILRVTYEWLIINTEVVCKTSEVTTSVQITEGHEVVSLGFKERDQVLNFDTLIEAALCITHLLGK